MDNHKAKIAIYARKSTESEDRQILSIDSQVKELRDFARQQELGIVRVFTESKSAKSPGRPIFNELMADVRGGKYNEILCWKLDRLARNPVDGGSLIWAMEEKELANIHTPQRTFINTGNDKFWMQLEFGMAKKYVDDLSDNVRRGMRAKLELGWRPTMAPLGYLNDIGTKTIIKDPERFVLVRRMWDLMLSGKYSAAHTLTTATKEWGLRTRQFRKKGGKPLVPSMIYELFRNPFYYGAINHKGEFFQGIHTPMVSKPEFDRVQELLGSDSHPRPKRYAFAFTGLIKCGECGAAITAENKTNRYGHKYIYYHCTKRKSHVKCRQKSIELADLDRQIEDFLGSIAIPKEIVDWTIKLLQELHSEEMHKDRLATESLARRYTTCSKEIDELLNLKLRGLLTDAEFVSKKSELENERIRLKNICESSNERFSKSLVHCRGVFEFASVAKNNFISGSAEMKKAILAYTGSNLILKDKKLLIEAQSPLLLIKKALNESKLNNDTFEPSDFSSIKRKKEDIKWAIPVWSRLVEDVRTFYWENRTNLGDLKLPDILQSIRKKD